MDINGNTIQAVLAKIAQSMNGKTKSIGLPDKKLC